MNNVERRLGKVELLIADFSADEAELIALFGAEDGRVVLDGLKRQGLSVADWFSQLDELFPDEPDVPSNYDASWGAKFAVKGYHVPVEPILPQDADDSWGDQDRQFRNGAV